MRIVIIGSYPLSPECIRGGVESSVYGLAQELAKTQSVAVLDMPRLVGKDAIEQEGNLTIHRYTNPGMHNQDATKRVNDMVRDVVASQPDAVHIHGTGKISAQLYKALLRHNIRPLVTVHGLLAVEKRNALRKQLSIKGLYQYFSQTLTERWLLNRCPAVIVDTEYVADAIRKYRLRHTPVMHIIPQGINAHYYDLRCSETSKNILSVGSISKRKGHILLVEAFEKACERGLDAHLQIYGVVAEQDYCDALMQRVDVSPYKDRITITLNASQAELDAAYTKAHLFALHTEEESQGIVFAEAMAVGLPVVSTRVGGVPYVVRDGECGLLSKYGDTEVFAKKLCELIRDEKTWQTTSLKAKQVAKNYSWTDIAEKIMVLYGG